MSKLVPKFGWTNPVKKIQPIKTSASLRSQSNNAAANKETGFTTKNEISALSILAEDKALSPHLFTV